MRHRVLWMEDEALSDLATLTAPIYSSGQYDLSVARDVTEGIRCLWTYEYSVVIVDIRLPPGSGQPWIDLWLASGASKPASRLGLRLLESLFDPASAAVKLPPPPLWIDPARFAVFTVEGESEVADQLCRLRIEPYRQKSARLPFTAVIDMIEQVISRQRDSVLREL